MWNPDLNHHCRNLHQPNDIMHNNLKEVKTKNIIDKLIHYLIHNNVGHNYYKKKNQSVFFKILILHK